MKKILFISFLLLISQILLNVPASAQNVQDFEINQFNAYFELAKNDKSLSQLKIDEYIQANFPDYDQNHGIIRAIPAKYENRDIKLRLLSVDQSVARGDGNQTKWPYTTENLNNNLVLKIGNPNNYVHGPTNYHIGYEIQNVTKTYDDHDELYWDINGDQWMQKINLASVAINLSPEVASNLLDTKCFAGSFGSKTQNCQISVSQNKQLVTSQSTKILQSGETLTVALSFKPNTFISVEPSFWDIYGKYVLVVTGVLLPPLLILYFIYYKWKRYGRDPKGRGTIIAMYEPPQNDSLLIHSFVLKEELMNSSISAQVVNLAIRKVIRIIDNSDLNQKKHKDFSLEFMNDNISLSEEEQRIIQMFFGINHQIGDTVNLSDLKYKLSRDVQALSKTLADKTLVEKYFVSNPLKIVGRYRLFGIILISIGGATIFIFDSLVWPMGIGLLISGIVLLVWAKAMPVKTLKGVELRDHLLGLKLYIAMAEQDRIKFHQSPETAQRYSVDLNDSKQMIKLFESLLPYAMLFGLEKEWSKQFENIYSQAPDWYSGNISTFNAVYLANSLNGFSSASSASFTSPSSSSGSGFSSGGGFAGGGGGGGGGGGW